MEEYLEVEVDSCCICHSADATQDILTDKLDGQDIYIYEAIDIISGFEIVNTKDNSSNRSLCIPCCERLLEALNFRNEILDTFHNYYASNCEELTTNDSEIDGDEIQVLPIECEEKKITSILQDEAPSENNSKLIEVDMSTDAVSFLLAHQSKQSKMIQSPEPRSTKSINTNRKESHKNLHQCIVCGKKFPKRSNLIDHLRLHAEIKKFVCSFCGKSFVQVANYRTHLRIHTKERPFICPLCEKSFNQSSSLKVHVRSHTQERNYGCSVCGKRFTCSSDLNKHKRVHDSSQKLKCEYCDKLFAQKVNLKIHQKKHHSVE